MTPWSLYVPACMAMGWHETQCPLKCSCLVPRVPIAAWAVSAPSRTKARIRFIRLAFLTLSIPWISFPPLPNPRSPAQRSLAALVSNAPAATELLTPGTNRATTRTPRQPQGPGRANMEASARDCSSLSLGWTVPWRKRRASCKGTLRAGEVEQDQMGTRLCRPSFRKLTIYLFIWPARRFGHPLGCFQTLILRFQENLNCQQIDTAFWCIDWIDLGPWGR